MKRILQNFNVFKKSFFRGLGTSFTILSTVLLLIPKEDIGITSRCRAIFLFFFLIFLSIIYAALMACFYKKRVVFDYSQGKLLLKYDDLWKIAFPKHNYFKDKAKKIVVVSVNTTFDTIVDEDLMNIKKPLVSVNTMHGQWIKEMQKRKVDIEEIDRTIQENLRLQDIRPIKKLERSQKERGKLECFEKGTVAVYEYNDTVFYLLALSEFDENNKAQNTKKELIKTIERLIEYYDNHGQGYELYIPLLGTGRSRTDISPEEALQIIVSTFKIYKSAVQGNVNIIVYKKQRDKVSLDI